MPSVTALANKKNWFKKKKKRKTKKEIKAQPRRVRRRSVSESYRAGLLLLLRCENALSRRSGRIESWAPLAPPTPSSEPVTNNKKLQKLHP